MVEFGLWLLAVVVFAALITGPWFFARRNNRSGARDFTILAVLGVILSPAIFLSWCEQSGCGQGAIAIFFLVPVAVLAAVAIAISGYGAVRSVPKQSPKA